MLGICLLALQAALAGRQSRLRFGSLRWVSGEWGVFACGFARPREGVQATRFEAIRHLFFRGRIADLFATVQRLEPDAVVSVQSGIEPSSLGMPGFQKAFRKVVLDLAQSS